MSTHAPGDRRPSTACAGSGRSPAEDQVGDAGRHRSPRTATAVRRCTTTREVDDQQRRPRRSSRTAPAAGVATASPSGQRRRNQSSPQQTSPISGVDADQPVVRQRDGHLRARATGRPRRRTAPRPRAIRKARVSTSQSRVVRRGPRPHGRPASASAPGSSQGCSGTASAGHARHARQPTGDTDQLPKSRPAVDQGRRGIDRWPQRTAGRRRQARPHDHRGAPHQAVRRPHPAVDDVSFQLRAGHRHRLPRPQRRRQVHHHADDLRAHPADRRHAPPSPGARTGELPNPGRQVGVLLDASAQHAGRTGREVLTLSAHTMGVDRRGSTRSSSWSGWTRRPRSAGSGRTRWACASGSAWRTRCSATPGC